MSGPVDLLGIKGHSVEWQISGQGRALEHDFRLESEDKGDTRPQKHKRWQDGRGMSRLGNATEDF